MWKILNYILYVKKKKDSSVSYFNMHEKDD